MQYRIFGTEFKPTKAMWSDAIKNDNVLYVQQPFVIKNIDKLYNKIKGTAPLFKYLLKDLKLNREDSVVFVYQNPWSDFFARTKIVDYLRLRYPNSIHVVRFSDIHAARALDIDFFKKCYDYIYIYDYQEAVKLGISYYPACYSRNFEKPSSEEEIYDIAFVGQAKNRFDYLIKIYERCQELNLSCNFYIVGVNSNEQKYTDHITYSSKFIDEETYYKEYISKSRCLLELTLENTNAITARVREAIIYDKKVLSNNEDLRNYSFYNSDMMKIISSEDEIETSFFSNKRISYGYNGEFSPIGFLNQLEKDFYRHTNS